MQGEVALCAPELHFIFTFAIGLRPCNCYLCLLPSVYVMGRDGGTECVSSVSFERSRCISSSLSYSEA